MTDVPATASIDRVAATAARRGLPIEIVRVGQPTRTAEVWCAAGRPDSLLRVDPERLREATAAGVIEVRP